MNADKVAADARELAELFPAPKAITVAGKTVDIARCGLAQAGRIISIGMPLYAAAKARERDLDLLELFDADPENSTSLVVAATGLDRQWVASLEPLDRFAIASAWLEVNGAFFVRRLLPLMAGYLTGMASLIGGAGRTSTLPSAPPTSATPPTSLPRPRRSALVLSSVETGAAAASA